MDEFKKRMRLLAESENCEMAYLRSEIRVSKEDRSIQFEKVSHTDMACELFMPNQRHSFQTDQSQVFDIIDRFADARFVPSLIHFKPKPLLTLARFYDEERVQPKWLLDRVREAEAKGFASSDFGGNRILIEYFKGVLILRDDLCWDATNVVEVPRGMEPTSAMKQGKGAK